MAIADRAPKATVAVMRAGSVDSTRALLGAGLDATGIADMLGQPGRTVTILAALPGAAPVDHRIIEELVDNLLERGWGPVTVAAAMTPRARDTGASVLSAVAAAAGLSGSTPGRNRFEVVNLYDDLVHAPLPAGSVLAGRNVGAAWAGASLRIALARSVSDLADGFSGCLDLLADVVEPAADVARADLSADVHHHLPASGVVIDATVSSHGLSGRSRLDPLETCTLIVGSDALLADVVLARLQGVDADVSRPVREALRRTGLPDVQRIHGDQTPFLGWRGPAPSVREAVRASGPVGERVAAGVVADGEADPVMSAIRRGAAYLAHRTGGESSLGAGVAAGSLAASYLRGTKSAWSSLLDKGKLDRVDMALGFDPAAYDEDAYRAIPAFLAHFEEFLALGEEPGELRWASLDEAVVFSVSRLLEAPFELFVERVDIARGISLMADYLGGRVVPVEHDASGRPTLQAERNLYLPEPNYLAFWGGLPIDVCKIELVEYADDLHRLLWRTVASPNGSATYDDGYLAFAAEGDRTRVSVLGRQQFTLPPFWQAVDLDRFPEVKAPLVEDAYRRFFCATFDNLEAAYEGRDYRIGRDPVLRPLPTESASMLLEIARDWLAERSPAGRPRGLDSRGSVSTWELDSDGFRHFPGPGGPASEESSVVCRVQAVSRQITDDYVTAVSSDWKRGLS